MNGNALFGFLRDHQISKLKISVSSFIDLSRGEILFLGVNPIQVLQEALHDSSGSSFGQR
jgi:hypothetical protein